jgi:hypothetical protein
MLQRGTKNFHMALMDGLFVASMESAAMVKSKSWDEILPNKRFWYNITKK